MTDLRQIEDTLRAIVEDQAISNAEKQALRSLGDELQADQLRFLRNKAFAIARDQLNAEGADAFKTLKWLEKFSKAIDTASESVEACEAYFSPGKFCRNAILDALKGAKQQVDICVFTISDDRITEAIIQTHQRGVAVRVITDNDKSEDRGSDIDHLLRQQLDLKMDKTRHHMHHKFMVVDQARLLNGSFNWTRSATEYNQENILLTHQPHAVKQFQRYFDELWQKL